MKTVELIPLPSPVKKTVAIPGSKSYTNRALILASLTHGPVTILNPLYSDDTKAMIHCLHTLGIEIKEKNDRIVVSNSIADIQEGSYTLNANLSGTTIRFILALACIVPGIKIIRGEEGLNKRPIKDLVDALRQLGAEITYTEKEGFPPVRVNSRTLTNNTVTLPGTISSQYTSALLMIAPVLENVTIKIEGEQISKPYIAMTIDSMKAFGVAVGNNNYQSYAIPKGQKYTANTYTVEGDYSSAGYLFAIAALSKSEITLTNLNPASVQADKQLLSVLQTTGSEVLFGTASVTVKGKGVTPVTLDVTAFPDQAQTIAVLAAFAKGTTTITGIQSLRVKETDRVHALVTELGKMGITTETTDSTITIHGGNPVAAAIDTYGDHRMAMSFAIAGSILEGIQIHDADVVTKTFPHFWEVLASLGMGVNTL